MVEIDYEILRPIVEKALKEDVGRGDLTSLACLEPNNIKAEIRAKSDGVVSGLLAALLAFDIVDSANHVRPALKDGDRFKKGDLIIEIEGFNQTVLTTERTALNFLAHLSGIASLTAQFMELIKGTKCRILDTRKTTPGLRLLEKAAVAHGGGTNHRIGLFDMVLIKDNHIKSAGSIKNAVKLTREYLETADFRLQFDCHKEDIKIEVEVETIDQLEEAIESKADRLLLDNQSLESLKEMVDRARSLDNEIELEASGNVSLETVADIAKTGVDFISVGGITHSAKASDFSLNIIED